MTRQKFFIDFEFAEGFFKPIQFLPGILFNKPVWQIHLISVGIAGPNKAPYYAINKNFKKRYANVWVRENVLKMLPASKSARTDYKTIPEIKKDILEYFGCKWHTQASCANCGRWIAPEGIELYGYFSAYDHVMLSTLFGTMINLPGNFPMYTRDLKQEMDRLVQAVCDRDRETSFNKLLAQVKKMEEYPKQESEHNAASDACWNEKLFQFLETLKQTLAVSI